MSTSSTSLVELATPTIPPVPLMLSAFDELPESAFVSVNIVCALFGCSPATVWRRARDGALPSPHKLGKRTTRWNVGELRSYLCR